MRAAALALVSAIAVASSGCAAMAAKAPATDRPVNEIPQCNTGKGAVGVDTVIAVLLGVGAIAVASEEPGPGVVLGLTAGAYGVSAAVGNTSANKCRKALEDYDEYMTNQQNAPSGLGGLATATAVSPKPAAPTPADPYDTEEPPNPGAPAIVPPKPPPPALPPPTPPKPTPPRPAPAAAADADADGEEAEASGDDPWGAFWQEVP